MAKFRPNAIVQAISGNVGGLNFAHGKNGHIVRAVGVGQSNNHEGQLVNRGFLDAARKDWETRVLPNPALLAYYQNIATNVTRTDNLGLPRNPTARQLYIRLFFLASQNQNAATIPGLPVLPAATPLHTMTLTADLITGLDWGYQHDGPLFGESLIVFLARSFRTNEPKVFRYYKRPNAIVFGPSPIDLTTEWESIFGPLVENEWVSVRAIVNWGDAQGKRFLWSPAATISAQVTP